MARIRTIRPEFFRHERLAELSPTCRLLFIGLWTLADRFGRLEDRPKRIKVEVLPYDSVDVDKLLTELNTAAFIVRYSSNGNRYISIPSFTKHQRITGKEASAPESIPAPPDAESVNHEGIDGETPGNQQGNIGENRKGIRSMEYGVRSVDVLPTHTPTTLLPSNAWMSLVECWNTVAVTVPTWHVVRTEKVQPQSQERLMFALRATPDLDVWEARFARAAKSAWLTGQRAGRDGRPFTADLWWVCENADKLDAGRYDDKAAPPQRSTERLAGTGHSLCQHEPRCTSLSACRDRVIAEVRAEQEARPA